MLARVIPPQRGDNAGSAGKLQCWVRASRMPPNIPRRRGWLDATSRLLACEHSPFYEHQRRAMRRVHSEMQENQPPTYPRYAARACPDRNCFT